jgi:hypothetical protein
VMGPSSWPILVSPPRIASRPTMVAEARSTWPPSSSLPTTPAVLTCLVGSEDVRRTRRAARRKARRERTRRLRRDFGGAVTRRGDRGATQKRFGLESASAEKNIEDLKRAGISPLARGREHPDPLVVKTPNHPHGVVRATGLGRGEVKGRRSGESPGCREGGESPGEGPRWS